MNASQWSGFEVDPVWGIGSAPDVRRRREASEQRRVTVQTAVREWIKEAKHQDWLAGVPSLTIDAADVDALRSKIDVTYQGADRRWAANYLARGLERGRQQCDWKVRVPAYVLTLRLPKPQLNAETFVGLTQVDAVERAILDEWARCASAQKSVTLETVLISAIWFSALLDRKRIAAVHAQLSVQALRVTPDGRWAWVEWQDAVGNWQRHVFDSITALLALRWLHTQPMRDKVSGGEPPGEPDAQETGLSRRLWRVLRTQHRLETFGINSSSAFLQAAQAKWHYRLPPVLAHFASGRIETVALAPHAWWRVVLGQRLAPHAEQTAAVEPVEDEEIATEQAADGQGKRGRGRGGGDRKASVENGVWVRTLMLGDNRRAQQVVAELRRRQKSQFDPRSLDWVLADWMIAQMRPRGRKGNRLSTARELLTRVDRRLHAVLGDSVPDDPAVWNDAIEAIMQAAPQRNRGNLRAALRLLDDHVRRLKRWEQAAADLDRDEGGMVDAQLVTETEFQALLHELQACAAPRECQIAAILGYRCGLRRTEIRGLRLIDWQDGPEPLLFVRSHAARALKRDSGRRVLALAALCRPEELDLLRAHRHTIAQLALPLQQVIDSVLLIPQAQDPAKPWPEESLFGPVQQALVAVCGEPQMRFHHLRHGAANRTLADLLGPVLPGAALLLDPHGSSADITQARHRALVGVGPALRPLLWATSAFMGHVSPQTTLGSYVHILDMLLGHAVATLGDVTIPTATLAWMAHTTAGHIDVQRHRFKAGRSSIPFLRFEAALVARSGKRLTTQIPLGCPWPAEPRTQDGQSVPVAVDPATKRLRNVVEALNVMHALWNDPSDPEALRVTTPEMGRVIAEHCHRWAALRGPSLARRNKAGCIDAPICVGDLRLDRPRRPALLQSRPLQRQAQACLTAWRSWHEAEPSQVEQALTLHWSVRDADDHAVVFTDPGQAARWLNAMRHLHTLGAPSLVDALRWLHTPKAPSAMDAQAQRMHWVQALQLQNHRVATASPRRFVRGGPNLTAGTLRADDGSGKGQPGGLLKALDAAAYVMTVSVLLRGTR